MQIPIIFIYLIFKGHSAQQRIDETWRIQVDVLNLFDSDDHDIDYYYASRLPDEVSDGVEDIHYHVFEPRQFRIYLTRNF